MNPVRTREDCFDWLTMDDVQTEAFAAYVGAKRYFETHDFAAETRDASPHAEDHVQPGGITYADGSTYVGRGQFLEHMLLGVVLRLEALAERKGVDLFGYDLAEALSGPVGCKTALEKLAHPAYSHLAGEVYTITDEQMDALPETQRTALKAGKPAVLPEGAL